jgi:hypothetical protein
MLRADNITCITVMLDPPGPPFSECILNKKKQISLSTCKSFFLIQFFKKTNFLSSALDTIEVDQSCETPQRPKLAVQRKEQILSPLSNGLTPVRVSLVSVFHQA